MKIKIKVGKWVDEKGRNLAIVEIAGIEGGNGVPAAIFKKDGTLREVKDGRLEYVEKAYTISKLRIVNNDEIEKKINNIRKLYQSLKRDWSGEEIRELEI